MNFTGEILLAAVFVLSSFSACFAFTASKLAAKPASILISQAKAALTVAVIFCIAAFMLFEFAFITDNFSLAAVAQYSSTDLSGPYKLSAAWAGPEGSLLLWTLLVYAFTLTALARFNPASQKITALSLAAGSTVSTSFAALLLFIVKPFNAATVTLDQGIGLNPLLQNLWNVIHPPLLFIGYAGLAVAFAIVIAFTFSPETDITKYTKKLRTWLLFSLLFLSLGITTGARWSYIELGWGGYWAWDPVENASLLPWLSAVAALHCIIFIKNNRTMQFWATILTPLGFALSILATFITRSGILQSVHAFGKNPMFTVLSILLAIIFITCLICIIKAARISIKTPQSKTTLHTNTILWSIWLMMALALIIAIATFWPILSTSKAVLTRAFYDRIASAAAILLVLILSIKESILLIKRSARFTLFICIAIATLSAMSCYYFLDNPKLAIALGSCVLCFMLICCKNFITKFKSRLAPDIIHLGFLLMIISAGFASLETAQQFQLKKNSPQKMQNYTITFTEFKKQQPAAIIQTGPQITVTDNKTKTTLWPRENLYPSGKVTTEVALTSTILEDIYLIYDHKISDDEVIITAKLIPMMTWLWISTLIIITGIFLSLFKSRGPK